MSDQTEMQRQLDLLEALQKGVAGSLQVQQAVLRNLSSLKDLLTADLTASRNGQSANPLARHGQKCFSQGDEDGVTIEIVRRLGLDTGTYAEFGVGNGLENNTLILAAMGWKGFWAGNEALAFKFAKATRFAYLRGWITLDNIVGLLQRGLAAVRSERVDVLSLDLDGNDIYFVEALLAAGASPRLFIVEFNGKFPPPARFQIAYDPEHRWAGDDYFGAALMNFVDLFDRFGYRLVCCTPQTGVNAFFVHERDAGAFSDVPHDLGKLYVAPRHHMRVNMGHKPSARVVETIING